MRYFVINGLLGQSYESQTIPLDDISSNKLKTIHKKAISLKPRLETIKIASYKKGSISKWKYNENHCKFIVKARNLEIAYQIGISFKNIIKIYIGLSDGDDLIHDQLIELKNIPNPKKGIDSLVDNYKSIWPYHIDKRMLKNELLSGVQVEDFRLEWTLKAQKNILAHKNLLYALDSLSLSHHEAGGYMTGSYFQFHYSRDRIAEPQDMKKKKYFENKMRYDNAFLSAFKAIEFILQKGNINKKEIGKLLIRYKNKYNVQLDKSYQAYHLKLMRKKINWDIDEILDYFLLIRNSVAAHGNVPSKHIILEDEVYEVQRFAEYLLGSIISPGDE